MKKFIITNSVFALSIIVVILIGLVLPNNTTIKTVDYTLITKHNLLKKAKSPKVILTGGSNVLFGFNSNILQDSLNMPVVNHAIHAGYGLKYILDDVVPFVNKGDILIVSPEYSHFIANNYLGKEPLLFSLTAVPSNIKLLSFKQLAAVSEYIPKFSFNRYKSFLYNLLKSPKPSRKRKDYTQFSINDHGDHFTHWDKAPQSIKSYNFNGTVNIEAITYLIDINKLITAKGAHLYISYPSLSKSNFVENEITIYAIDKALRETSLHIIGQTNDFVFDDNVFYDTAYHLTTKGIHSRSLKLVHQLRKVQLDD